MLFLKLLINITVSYFGVLAQGQMNHLDQWVLIYLVVFVVSWVGGMAQGMISTVVSLSLAGFLLIPRSEFEPHHLLELLVLTALGFWISFSMHEYKRSLKKLNATEDLDKARGFLDTLLENLPLTVFVKDAQNLRFVKINKTGLDLFGYEARDMLGKNDFDFFPQEQAKFFTNADREVLNSGLRKDIPTEHIDTKDNGRRVLHTRKIPILDEHGQPLYLLGVSEDITEALKAETFRIQTLADNAAKAERLRLQERESFVSNAISSLSTTLDYQETLQRMVTLVVPSLGDWCTLSVKNDDGDYERVTGLHCNPDLQPLLEEFAQEFPPSTDDPELRKALEFGEPTIYKAIRLESLIQRSADPRKGELYTKLGAKSVIIIPIRSRDKISGALSIVRGPERDSFDRLDLLLAEEIGRRAGTVLENSMLFKSTQVAVRARDEFLSIASHELKTPITALKMQLQMIQRTNGEDKSYRALSNAVKQIDRLTVLVDDLLNVSKIEAGKMSYAFQELRVREVMNDVVDNSRNQFAGAGVELKLDVQDDLEILGDRFRLEQVFVNLLSNALKYGEGKPVTVEISRTGNDAAISVRDQGRGIPVEFHKKIFDKFERGRQDSNISGLGLGLFISHEIVEAHGGKIEIKSHPGEGAEFKVTIPLKPISAG